MILVSDSTFLQEFLSLIMIRIDFPAYLKTSFCLALIIQL